MGNAFIRSRGRFVPLAIGITLLLAGCGGGGGGDGVSGGGTGVGSATPAGFAPGGSAGTSAASVAEVRYTLGSVGIANTTTDGFQTLEGMAATPDGGYRIVWSTGSLDANNRLQLAWFEQRYDASGQRVGSETPIAGPGGDLSGSRSARVPALGGGYLEFGFTDAMRPGLLVQQFGADGIALDAPITLGGASHGWSFARLPLADGSVAITWQALSSVGPAELQTAVLRPGPG